MPAQGAALTKDPVPVHHSSLQPQLGIVIDKGAAANRYYAMHEPTRRLCCEEGHNARWGAVGHGEYRLATGQWG